MSAFSVPKPLRSIITNTSSFPSGSLLKAFSTRNTHNFSSSRGSCIPGKCFDATTISTGLPFTSRKSCRKDLPVSAASFTESSDRSDTLNSSRHLIAFVNFLTASSTENLRSLRNQKIISSSSLPFLPTGRS
uniref:Uncharacterized protein n=1 Tax=Opuntia streptacantha TaxID=393608 RepID=A0A7C9E0M3_OPUST